MSAGYLYHKKVYNAKKNKNLQNMLQTTKSLLHDVKGEYIIMFKFATKSNKM